MYAISRKIAYDSFTMTNNFVFNLRICMKFAVFFSQCTPHSAVSFRTIYKATLILRIVGNTFILLFYIFFCRNCKFTSKMLDIPIVLAKIKSYKYFLKCTSRFYFQIFIICFFLGGNMFFKHLLISIILENCILK